MEFLKPTEPYIHTSETTKAMWDYLGSEQCTKDIEMVQKKVIIKQAIKDFYKDADVDEDIDERILNYVDDDWEEDGEYDSEYEWYVDYGRGEAEDEIINEILDVIAVALGEKIDEWYHGDKYGDINELIYETYPSLKTN